MVQVHTVVTLKIVIIGKTAKKIGKHATPSMHWQALTSSHGYPGTCGTYPVCITILQASRTYSRDDCLTDFYVPYSTVVVP